MKLFWKFFFCIMIVTQICFSIGCYALIQTNFKDSLKREIESTYNENDMVYSLFSFNYSILRYEYYDEESANNQLSSLLSYQTMRTETPFQIETDSKVMINYKYFDNKYNTELKKSLKNNQRVYKVISKDGHYYINCIRRIQFDKINYFIGNYHQIDDLFINRSQQFQLFSILMIFIFIVNVVVSFVLSWWLTRPLNQLSSATKSLANHNYNVYLPVSNKDEIGELSRDFLFMAEQIQNYIEELKGYNQKQEMFIGNFTHELKTPLTSIIGYADMLRSKKVSEHELILSANQIVLEGRRLESISKKLMDLIVLKKHDFQFYKTSTTLFLNEIADTISPVLKKANIQFSIEIDEGEIYIEKDLMKTVCLNLIDNAKNAIEENGEIRLQGIKKDKEYHIIISDNGKGISEEDIHKITEAFYMVDKSRTREHGGAGLGLAIVNEIVNLHHASIHFDSVLTKGTQVTLILKEGKHD